MSDLPFISVVIPIKNEARYIESTILQILNQNYPADKMEIIVACGESGDNSLEIVQAMALKDSRVKVFGNRVGRASGGRNIGIRNASGDIITFIDGHTYIPDSKLLMNTARLMAEKEVDVLSRPQFLEPPDNNHFQQAVALARRSVIGHGLDSTIYTAREMYVEPTSSGASYRKEIFQEFGVYDERFDACEDVEFNYRLTKAGRKSFTSMLLAVYYYPRESVGQLFNQMKRYGIGRLRLGRKHPATLTLATLIPALFTGGMPLLAIGSLISMFLGKLFILLFAAYLIGILAGSSLVALRNGFKFLTMLPLIYFTIHVGLGWGFLTEALKTFAGKGISLNSNP